MKKLLFVLWTVVAISLLLYSFTQVDLGLTLTRASIWQGIQRNFQYIGYFNRPLSAQIFGTIMTSLFFLYLLTMYILKKKLLGRKDVWKLIFIVAGIVVFSYNAFSYDLFNYIFDAKILTHYNQNPYEHRALDFPGDPMLGFMRWTHRTYQEAYGPGWLLVTLPLSYAGLNFFLVTFYIFKFFIAGCYLGAAYLIEKIARKTKIIDPLFALGFFALNPLVITESLISAHNEMPMMVLALLAMYYVIEGKYLKSVASFIFSVSIKYATAFAIPIFFYPYLKKRLALYFDLVILSMITAIVLASLRTNFQPWYLLYSLTFVAFRANKYFYFIPTVLLSFLPLSIYGVYLYHGNVSPPVPEIMQWFQDTSFQITGAALLLGVIFFEGKRLIRKYSTK